MTDQTEPLARVRRQWDSRYAADYRLSDLLGVHWAYYSGGVFAPAPGRDRRRLAERLSLPVGRSFDPLGLLVRREDEVAGTSISRSHAVAAGADDMQPCIR
jgi:hypothetical protein